MAEVVALVTLVFVMTTIPAVAPAAVADAINPVDQLKSSQEQQRWTQYLFLLLSIWARNALAKVEWERIEHCCHRALTCADNGI